jgi:4-amino-4-deoxy-L-arabinose transferase-like glycosyltransferase
MTVPGPPLYLVVGFYWAHLFGESELMVRLPSLVGGLGSIVLTYLIALRFLAGGTAFLAALVLCFSPAHVWYSQEATPYALTLFFLLVAVYVWPHVPTVPFSVTRWVIYLSALLSAVFTHYYAAVFLAPFTLLSVMTERTRRSKLLLAHGLVVLALGLWFATRYREGRIGTGGAFLGSFTLFHWWMLFFNWFLQGNALWTFAPFRTTLSSLFDYPEILAVQLAAAVVVVRGLWRSGPRRVDLHGLELALYLCSLPLVLLVLSLAGYRHVYIERYLLITLPFFVIALVRGATSFSSARLNAVVAAFVLLLTVASYAALLRKDTRWTIYKPNPDWRSAAMAIRSANTPPERVVLLTVIPLSDFDFYLRKQMPEGRPRIERYNPPRSDRRWIRGQAAEVVVVKNRYWANRVDRVIEELKRDSRLRLTTVQSFKGVELHRFLPTGVGNTRTASGEGSSQ